MAEPIEKIIARATNSVADIIMSGYRHDKATESPIEKLFLTALSASAKYIYPYERDCVRIVHHPDCWPSRNDVYSFVVKPQCKIGKYRVDFLVFAYDFANSGWDAELLDIVYDEKHWRKMIVECDGHDFHERTKEQAARDRKRDRELSLKGYDVFRFTGSEIWRDPIKCAEDVIQWARFMP